MNVALSHEIVSLLNRTYKNARLTQNHLEDVVAQFRGLLPRLEVIKASSGEHSIVALTGTISITFKNVQYNTPLHIRVLPDYPHSAPVVFLTPTPDMAIMPHHPNVDGSGRCFVSYLTAWTAHSALVPLLNALKDAFSARPALYMRPAGAPHQQQQQQQQQQPQQPQQPQPQPQQPQPPQHSSSLSFIHNLFHRGSSSSSSSVSSSSPTTTTASSFSGPSSSLSSSFSSSASNFVAPNPSNTNSNNITTNTSLDGSSSKGDTSASSAPPSDDDAKLCIVCFERPKEALITPCNHVAVCMQDATFMKNNGKSCPVCRGDIGSIIRVFIV